MTIVMPVATLLDKPSLLLVKIVLAPTSAETAAFEAGGE